MGIPHLITVLQPFAIRKSLRNQKVVIDGPGFAHHIYYICLNSSRGAENAFEAAPTYSGLVKTAFSWLEALQNGGVNIEKIYFDGFLPATKMETRLSRLTTSTTRLSQYHAKKSVPCKAQFETSAGGASVLFGNSAVRSSFTSLPSLPFLVPAIIEALGGSKFAHLVEVVPGEADPFCASHMNEHGGITLTGDSDLLVHDLGDNGAVSFFKAILLDEAAELSSLVYRQADIIERLALPVQKGLQYLAFEMHMNPHGRFPKLLAQAKLKHSVLAYSKLFVEFIQEYTPLPQNPEADASNKPESLMLLQTMDPRISEYALQFTSLALFTGHKPNSLAAKGAHVFLPFILDCPARTNSWEIATESRQLGYGLINLIATKPEQRTSVFEHRRRQNKSKGLELQLPSISNIPEACRSLVSTLVQVKEKLRSLSPLDYWLAVAVYQEVEWAFLYDKSSFTESVVRQVKKEESDPNLCLTWDSIHFLGQIQANLYSLRLLKQLTSLVVAHFGKAVPADISSLHRELTSLPHLDVLPSYGDIVSLVKNVHDLGMLKCARELLGQSGTLDSEAAANAERTSKKGKRKRDKSASETTTDRKKSTNPFDLLAVE